MATMTVTEPMIDVRGGGVATGFAGPLMAAHAEAGALLAELMERPAGLALVPVLAAELASRARHAADLVDGTSHAADGLEADAAVPAVVWAREVAAAQRLLGRALECGGAAVGDAAAERLAVAAREMREMVRELAALTGAVA